ncbi:hypothetical protein [Tenacibaculum sp. Ill]|uniref:hypothetical protein n=1 Tax=Tenacibaculum sp. Ill TaxID=3445935 RepID=UPI003F792EDE
MKFKKKFSFLVFSFFITCNLVAQQDGDVYNNRGVSTLSTFNSFDYSKIKGTPFITDGYLPLKISDFKDDLLTGRYNAHRDYFEIRTGNSIKSFLPNENALNREVFLNKKVYKAFKHSDGKIGFFLITFSGKKITLMVKEEVELIEAVEPKTGYDKFKPANFKRKKDVFFIHFKRNNSASELPKSKKQFINLFGNNSVKIKNYIKQNRLNIKKLDDVKKVLKFYEIL